MQFTLKTFLLSGRIRSIGSISSMDDYEKRKLGIFNTLNSLGFLIGILLPFIGLFLAHIDLPAFAWLVTFSPAMVSILVLILNYYKQYELGIFFYFILYPVLTALVYLVSFDVGCELFFILYGVLSVFFLRRLIYAVVAFLLTLCCYFFVFVFTKKYDLHLSNLNFAFYVLNHLIPALFIFYALFLVKRENTQYHLQLLANNNELKRVNLEIQQKNALIDEKARLLQRQNEIIDEKARLLEKKTDELTELNSMKNKLFSVISHDLKNPLYALRNLFRSVQQYDMPAEEIKQFVPEVVTNLNYTTALMENLLIWVKSQMQIIVFSPQILELSELVRESTDLLQLQAAAKDIRLRTDLDDRIYIYADKEMISLVIRNLLSNAIKFTPQGGTIDIWGCESEEAVELFVQDSGVGMEPEIVQRLFENSYYSTKGTAQETGTGLGLMLCKDFLVKNGGKLHVVSTPGKGSTFSFRLVRKMKAIGRE